MILKAYSCLCFQRSLLKSPWIHLRFQWLNQCQPLAKQLFYPLYCGPNFLFEVFMCSKKNENFDDSVSSVLQRHTCSLLLFIDNVNFGHWYLFLMYKGWVPSEILKQVKCKGLRIWFCSEAVVPRITPFYTGNAGILHDHTWWYWGLPQVAPQGSAPQIMDARNRTLVSYILGLLPIHWTILPSLYS